MQIGKEMAIPSILKIGNGALGKIGSYLKTEGLDQVVLFFGNGLIDMFGELVMNSRRIPESPSIPHILRDPAFDCFYKRNRDFQNHYS